MIQKTSQRQLNALMGHARPTQPDGRTVVHNPDGPEEWGYWVRDRHYSLETAQHPIRARMCGFGDKDRRPLAPAAVAKMIVRRRDNSIVEVDDIDYDFFVVTVDLWSADGKEEMNLVLHPSASDRYLPTHLAKPRKRQANELAGVPGGPNNATTLTARSSTRPSPYPSAVERIKPFSNHPPGRAHDGGGGSSSSDNPNSLTPLLTSPTVPSSYPYPSSDAWSTPHPTQTEQGGQWTYSSNHSQAQSLTLPSIHSLDSNTFGTNSHSSNNPTSASPVPFHMMMSSLADSLQNQYHLSPVTPGPDSSMVNFAGINESNNNNTSGGGFRSWTDNLFDSVSDSHSVAAHDSFSQLPNLSHLPTMDPWSPTSPTIGSSLSQVTSFQAFVQQVHQNTLSLSSPQALPSVPPTPTAIHPPPPQSRQEKNKAPSNASARERELSTAIANAIPRHTYTRTLVGPLSANAQRLQDEHRKPGIFFLFQDLSIRTEGTFRLRMRLMNVGVLPAPNGCSNSMHTGVSPVLAQVFTEPFTVYSAKRFPGVPDTTALSIAFGNQGQKLPLRNRHANNKFPRRLGRADCPSSDEESL